MTQDARSTPLSRRGLFAGAATVGAVAAATAVLPRALQGPASPTPTASLARPERGGGYTLSAHVQQYYKTTRV